MLESFDWIGILCFVIVVIVGTGIVQFLTEDRK